MKKQRAEALIIIDVQNDFLPGGALAVPNGDQVIPIISEMASHYACIVATQDWHPPNHISFASTRQRENFETVEVAYGLQTLWPDHCVQHQRGADLAQPIHAIGADMIIRKGMRPMIDSYSAFCEADGQTLTGLGGFLCERGITRVVCAGLATDFCVRASAMDAVRFGFDVGVSLKACQGININGSLRDALDDMQKHGVILYAE